MEEAGPDDINGALILLAQLVLGNHFFDPEHEQSYQQKLSTRRPRGKAGVLLEQSTIALPDGACVLRIEAVKTWTHFRVALRHPAFTATVEGAWSFENEELRQPHITRTGGSAGILAAVEAVIEDINGSDLDEAEFAGFLDSVGLDETEAKTLIGDDPAEPPSATKLDRSRIQALAERIGKHPDADLRVQDRGWLEQTPQTLPVIAEALITAAGAAERNEPLILALQILLALQLEFVRYRQDRGWNWADAMLMAFIQRLIEIGQDTQMPREDWFLMRTALNQARVPISDATQTALADSGFMSADRDDPPEDMLRSLRGFMDELARMVTSPFEVSHSLQNAGAMLPAKLRGFMATELALSPHPVLRCGAVDAAGR